MSSNSVFGRGGGRAPRGGARATGAAAVAFFARGAAPVEAAAAGLEELLIAPPPPPFAAAATAATASSLVNVPLGPVADRLERESPAWRRRRAAAGPMRRAGEDEGEEEEEVEVEAAAAEVEAAAAGAAADAASSSTRYPSNFATSSLSSTRISSGAPTGMSLDPSGRSKTATKPSSWFSQARTALSVSTSASASPGATSSPTFTCHAARLPWDIVGERAGMPREVWGG